MVLEVDNQELFHSFFETPDNACVQKEWSTRSKYYLPRFYRLEGTNQTI